MVLAIEADGASYHSSPTARDRDRLRQEQLERLGWRFHRIWSTDWFTDADACVAKARVAYDRAVAATDASARLDTGPAAPAQHVARGRALQSATDAPQRRGPRPNLAPGLPITAYSDRQLVAMIRWIESDTLLRTEDQLFEEFMKELGFRRRGSRIEAAFDNVLRLSRRS